MNSRDSCWGYVGSRWLQVGSKMAQDRFMLAPRRPQWPLKASQAPQDEAKITPGFSGAWKASILIIFWNEFRSFLVHFWYLGSCIPLEVSRYPHECCRMAYLSLSGPAWTQVGSKLRQVGPMLDPSWLQLGSSRSGAPAAPEPTQALPNPFPVASGPPKPPFVPYRT